MPSSSPRSHAEEVAGGLGAYLASLGLASWDDFGEGEPYTRASSWPVFIGPDMPTSPDQLIVITPGVSSVMRADVTQQVQIRLRGLPYEEGDFETWPGAVLLRAQQIHDALYPNGFPLAHVTLGRIRVGAVYPGDALPLTFDTSRRYGHVQNFRVRARR